MRFRGQGFTAAQAHYLARPYVGRGHHFLIPRGSRLPRFFRESPANVLKPKGISRGRFYELHYRVDPHFYFAPFPRRIPGGWRGPSLGLRKYGPVGRLWYGSPDAFKLFVGILGYGGGRLGMLSPWPSRD
jgi:hypothetical protein